MKKNVNVNLGWGGLLGIIFVLAKIFGKLDWSWFWVLAPFWIPFAVFAVVCAAIFGFAFLAALVGAATRR